MISTLEEPFEVEIVSASDSLAARIGELQLDVAQGPGWEAHITHLPVCIPDLGHVAPDRWPLFTAELADWRIQAIYSFPLSIGTLHIGAVDLYADAHDALSRAAVNEASVLAEVAATRVLRHSLRHRHDVPGEDGPHSRREVHQATGMVIAQMQVGAADALLLIRAHAYASGRSVRETAADITARRISLES